LDFEVYILSDTLLDAEIGVISDPVLWTGELINEIICTRRIPVREELSKGWRTWVVDHVTESMINVAAFTQKWGAA
jgi:3-methyladenine DNA glycosylase Mpg